MRISRSLTIKQMVAVTIVVVITICLFTVIQLFHFVQQHRMGYVWQMENITQPLREPLAMAMFNSDLPQVKNILENLKSGGIIARAEITLPDGLQVVHCYFLNDKPIPHFIDRLFNLPVKITLPLYSLEHTVSPRPLAYLTLQADSWQIYQFLCNTFAMMVVTYLLLVMILSIAISWYINRLIIHPLRDISRELYTLSPYSIKNHKLLLPHAHRDDEIGLLIRSYNHNQQQLASAHDEISYLSTHFAITGLPGRSLFLAMLEQEMRYGQPGNQLAVLVCHISIGQDKYAILTKAQQHQLMQTLADMMSNALNKNVFLAQLASNEFVLLIKRTPDTSVFVHQAQTIMRYLDRPVFVSSLQFQPSLSIGLTVYEPTVTLPGTMAAELLNEATSAMLAARLKCNKKGKNQLVETRFPSADRSRESALKKPVTMSRQS